MCYTKTLPFKFIGVVLWLLNSQWKMHHCDVPSSFFLVFFGMVRTIFGISSPAQCFQLRVATRKIAVKYLEDVPFELSF